MVGVALRIGGAVMAPLSDSERLRLSQLEARNRELELAQRRSVSEYEHQLAAMLAAVSTTLQTQEENRERTRLERERRERENASKRHEERLELAVRMSKMESALQKISGFGSTPAIRLLLQFLAIALATFLNSKR